ACQPPCYWLPCPSCIAAQQGRAEFPKDTSPGAPPKADKKSPAFRRDLSLLSRQSANGPDWGWVSAPDGSGPAAAGRASGRRPAADRASDPGSGSAGP